VREVDNQPPIGGTLWGRALLTLLLELLKEAGCYWPQNCVRPTQDSQSAKMPFSFAKAQTRSSSAITNGGASRIT
jgi:hypothetical protein